MRTFLRASAFGARRWVDRLVSEAIYGCVKLSFLRSFLLLQQTVASLKWRPFFATLLNRYQCAAKH